MAGEGQQVRTEQGRLLAPGAQVPRGVRLRSCPAGAPVAAAVQPVQRQQRAQRRDQLSLVTVSGPGAVERHVVRCAVHGPLSAHFRLIDARRVRRCAWCEGRR